MLSVIYLSFLLVCFSTGNAAPGDELVVTISDGSLAGIEAVTDDSSVPFWAFLGIPYAAPPTGDLRFKPPQAVLPWSGIRNATYERDMCTQSQNPIEGIEDCLFINVFTTIKPNNNETLLPVMVWIHGGGFAIGTGNIGLHGGDRFLNNGVILVSLNYRLGIFGFLCTEDASSPGNYGLKDQIAALKWVQRNIIQFGGDPNQVTIFGQSSGGVSVHYLLQSNLTNGLYRAAISESGSTLVSWAMARNPKSRAFKIGVLNLIAAFDTKTLVNRLRNVSYEKLQNAASQILLQLDAYNGLAWAPYFESDVDGAVVTSYSYSKLLYGNFVQVPLLTGFNSNEARSVATLKWLDTLFSTEFSIFPEKLVPKDMNSKDTSQAASKIKIFYFNNKPIMNDTRFVHYASDTLFVRGIHKTVQLQSKYVPVYFYRFSFIGGVQHAKFKPEGASHTEELQFLFNYPNSTQITPEAKLTETRMLKLWTNFAKTRNPTPDVDPVLNITWPLAGTNGDGNVTYLDIGEQLEVKVNPENAEMTFWDKLYDQYGFQPYNTY